MAAGGFVGAAFGEGFAILHDTVKHVVGQIIMFKSILKSLESTLDGIAPVVQEIRRSSLALDHPDEETKRLIEQMKKGKELILKCSKIKRWNLNYCFKAYSYSIKLKKLNNAIEKFCQIDLTVQNTRTALETLIKVNQTTTAVLETAAKVDLVLKEVTKQNSESKKKKFEIRTLSCAASRPRDYIVGLELPLKELKQLLSNKEVSLLLLTALGGCGKTTLVKMLCWDEDIKGIYGENIFFVNVSQAPNLKVMVQKLFNHNGAECNEFQSDEEAIDQLEQLLNEIGQKQPILLILDDVWPGSESLIEKFKFDIPAYKIVVTSRTAFPRFRYRYNLNPLNPVDAMSLFCYSASLHDQDESSYIPEEYIEK
ncbi:putative disease resistance protein, partial [Quercus suber]